MNVHRCSCGLVYYWCTERVPEKHKVGYHCSPSQGDGGGISSDSEAFWSSRSTLVLSRVAENVGNANTSASHSLPLAVGVVSKRRLGYQAST